MSRRVFVGLAWIALILIGLATMAPIGLRPHLGSPTIERAAAFALAGLLLGLAYPRRPVAIALVLAGTALALETLQLLTPDRHGSLTDLVPKVGAGLLGLGLAMVLTRSWSRMFRSR